MGKRSHFEADGSLELGACCSCGATEGVRNIMMLGYRAPVPGTGWGCVVCGLPADGAVAVVCDACLAAGAPVKRVCRGYPSAGERVGRKGLKERFEHNLSKHPELREEAGVCMVCGCTEDHPCPGGCRRVLPNLCSRCFEELREEGE